LANSIATADGPIVSSRKGRELDAAGFIRAKEDDKLAHINKKICRKFYFFVKIGHIKYIKQKSII